MGKKIGLFLLLVSIVMITYGLYLYYFNPKKVMLESLSREISNIDLSHIKIGKTKLISKSSLSYGNEKYENNIDFSFDSSQMKMYLKDVLNTNNNDKHNIELFLENNKMFFNIKDISDKLNYIEITTNAEKIQIPKSELNALVQTIGKIFVDTIPENKFSSKSESITINKNHFDSKKYTVSLTLEDYYNVVTSIFEHIEKESKFSTIKSIVFTDDKFDKIHLNINTYHSDLKKIIIGSNDETKQFINYSLYLYKNKVVLKHELSYDLQKNSKEVNAKISFASIDKGNNLKDYELVLQKNNKNVFEIIIAEEKNNSVITCLLQEFTIQGSLEKDGTNKSLKLDIFDNAKTQLGKITGEYKEVRPNEEYKLVVGASATIKNKSLLLSSDNTILKNQEVSKFNVVGAQKYKNNLFEAIRDRITKVRVAKRLINEADLKTFKLAVNKVLDNAITCNALKPVGEVCTASEIKKYDTDTSLTYDIMLSSSVYGNVVSSLKFINGKYLLDITGGEKCTINTAKSKINELKVEDGNNFAFKCE